MADDVIVIGGDVSGINAALDSVEKRTAKTIATVNKLAAAFGRAEQEASDLAASQARAPKREQAGADQAALERSVKLRKLEADELEHQVVLLRTIGAEQTQIVAAQQAAVGKRKEAATLSRDQVELTKLRRQQEVAAAEEIGKRNDEIARRQKKASEASAKRISLIKSHWQEVVAVVIALVAGIKAADAAMLAAFGQRTVLDNLPFKIDAARQATLGLVDANKLSEVAITANRLKIVSSEEEFGRLANAATKLGLSVGRDAASALDDLTGALGRGSTEVLDNLGIQLKVAEAQRLYALQLGITTKALTADQKAEAFRVIGLQKALEAAENVTVTIKSQEQAWLSAKMRLDTFERETLPQLTERLGGLWTALEGGVELVDDVAPVFLTWLDGVATGLKPVVAVVGFFGAQLGAIARGLSVVGGMLDRTTARVGEFADGVGDWIADSFAGDAASWISDTTESMVDLADNGLDRLTDSINEQLPFTVELGKAWDEVTDAVLGTDAAIGTLGLGSALGDLLDAGKDLAKQQKTDDAGRLQALKEQVTESEFQVKLAEAQGRPASQLEQLYRAQHQAKLNLLRATGDQAALEAAQNDEQIRAAKAKSKRRGGGGSTEAQRLAASFEADIEAQRLALEHGALVAERTGTLAAEAEAIAQDRLDISVEELENEQEVLTLTRAKNAAERIALDGRFQAIDAEIELLHVTEAIAKEARDEAEVVAANEAVILSMDREIERLNSLGVATQLLTRDRDAAQLAMVEAHGTSEEIATAQHEAQLLENEARRARDVEIAENKLLVFDQDAELAEARGIQIADLASQRLDIEAQVAAAEGDNDKLREVNHKRELTRIKESTAKRKAATQAAAGFMQAGSSLFSTIVGVAVKDEKKREKAALRARGVEALARGALEVVEAVSSFASFNFVQGGLHTAAAAVAFIQGGSMLAGRIPGGGAAGAAAGGGAGGGRQEEVFVAPSDDARGPASQPASAQALHDARGGGPVADTGAPGAPSTGGNVTNIGTLVTSDTGDMLTDMTGRQTAQRWGT